MKFMDLNLYQEIQEQYQILKFLIMINILLVDHGMDQ